MPVPTRPAGARQARAERTRALVVEEMVACVLEEGFAAASARRVAERAGVTWGVVQYHFGDRDGILAAVVEAGYAATTARMAAVQVPAGSRREQVAGVVDAAWDAFSSPLARASFEILVATRTDRDPSVDDRLAAIAREVHRLGRALAPDHPGVGDVMWSALRGMALNQMMFAGPLDTARERAVLVDVLTAYLS